MSNKFVSVSNGLRIRFGKSGFEADILQVSHSGIARALIETTHMGTPEPGDGEIGGKTFIVDPLEDPGQLQLQVHYDPSNPPKRTDPDDPEAISPAGRKDRPPVGWAGCDFDRQPYRRPGAVRRCVQ